MIAGQLGQPHPSNQWIIEAWEHKKTRAESISEPRILVAGGSNAMFGISSPLLEKTLERPVANLGVNAGLGLPVIIDQTLSVAKSRDIVIMALEYPLFNHYGKINHVMNNFYLSKPTSLWRAWKLYLEALPWHKSLSMILYEAFQILMQTSPSRLAEGYRGLPEGFVVSGTYGAHRLDSHGDQTQTSRELRTPGMARHVVHESPRHYGAQHLNDGPAWSLLMNLKTTLQQRGVYLVLVPPAFLFHPSYQSDPVEEAFYTSLPSLAEKNGLLYAGQPFDFMYLPEDMFDTDFHLVDEARTVHTGKLIDVLHKANTELELLAESLCQAPKKVCYQESTFLP